MNDALPPAVLGNGVKVKLPSALIVTLPPVGLSGVVLIVIVVPVSTSVPPSVPAG